VNWNLDRPRREVPDLPAAPRRDLPPAREFTRASAGFDVPARFDDARDVASAPIDDNRACVSRCTPVPTDPVARRTDDRGNVAARR
jgi:hypothetical protein